MTAVLRRVTGPALLAALSLALAGCSAGGFGGSVEPEEPRPPIRSYVALGDGFTAAPFAGKNTVARGCMRGSKNYPEQVAIRIGVEVEDVSCTGATTRAVLFPSEAPVGKGQLPAQLDAVTEDTDLVTLTAGVSDKDLLIRGFYVCMEAGCDSSRVPPQQLGNEVAEVGDAIAKIIRVIQEKSPNAFIVVVGYPAIAPPEKGCKGLPELDDLQILGVKELFAQINGQLRSAAQTTGAVYADLSKETLGHDVCAKEPWVRSPVNKQGKRYILLPLEPEPKVAADAVMAAVATR